MSRSGDGPVPTLQFQAEPVPARDKVVAAPWQVVALHQLLRRAGENPPKEEIVQTSKETGLEVRWIRNWLSRYRKGRTRSIGDDLNATRRQGPKTRSATASTVSSIATAADSSGPDTALGGTISIHRLLQIHQDTGRREKRKRKSDASLPSSDSAAEASGAPAAPYVQIAKPGTSFSLPLNPTPQAQLGGSSSSFIDPSQLDTGIKTRSLTQSPSLGYIPLAFPMQLVQPPGATLSDHSVPDIVPRQPTDVAATDAPANLGSQCSIAVEANHPMMYSQYLAPVVPTLPLGFTQPDSADGQPSSNMLYLSQLLLDASNVHVPHPATGSPSDSEYLSVLSPLSFAPSMQSHSTSVLGTVSMNFPGQNVWYPPPPVAFRARVTDLALLTKRIRTTYEQSVDVSDPKDSSIEDVSTDVSVSTASEASCGSSLLSVSRNDTSGSSAATTPDEDDSDVEEELLTPTGDIPSFIDGLVRREDPPKITGKGKHVAYEDGVLSEVV